MMTACANKILYIYDINGNYKNKNVTTQGYTNYIGFDSNSLFLIISNRIGEFGIDVFN
jgi:hypothetical protein